MRKLILASVGVVEVDSLCVSIIFSRWHVFHQSLAFVCSFCVLSENSQHDLFFCPILRTDSFARGSGAVHGVAVARGRDGARSTSQLHVETDVRHAHAQHVHVDVVVVRVGADDVIDARARLLRRWSGQTLTYFFLTDELLCDWLSGASDSDATFRMLFLKNQFGLQQRYGM